MITIKIYKNNNNVVKIEVIGHANYNKHGNDIVCAAVSSTVLTTINGLLTINKNYLKYKHIKDTLIVDVIKNDYIIKNLLNNMINMLLELKDDYPKHIKIIEEVIIC